MGLLFFSVVVVSFLWFFFFEKKIQVIQNDETERAGANLSSGVS